MKQQEFLKILSGIRYKWSVWYDGSIRANCRVRGCQSIVCPITAVAKKVTKQFFHESRWRTAAKKLGLHHETAKNIVYAADTRTMCPRVRKKLERAVV